MPSYFDRLQKTTFRKALGRFGYVAAWKSQDGLAEWEGTVLFKNPSEVYKLAGVPFEPGRYTVEYQEGQLVGLKERIDLRLTTEIITVDGVEYIVNVVDAIHDGLTFQAQVVPLTENS